MKVFNPSAFLNVTVTALQAEDCAFIADRELEKASFVMYGNFQDGQYYNFSSERKEKDTHKILAYLPNTLRNSGESLTS